MIGRVGRYALTAIFIRYHSANSAIVQIQPNCKCDSPYKKTNSNFVSQVKELAASKYDVENLELSKMLEDLNLQESIPSMPAYDDLYPQHWANNDDLESRHKDLMLKIKKWPLNDKNEV